ncbi:MAG TPA: beta-ketoacyl synthase N-terminal-like domain-containing protein [Armatimonadota bacterium]|nr:beta-ketoacyl synthase N-terminal-like domain-containing protein [Armatimonadota bacterium]
MRTHVAATGVAGMSALGPTPGEHRQAMALGISGLRPLGELGVLGAEYAAIPGGWITPRSLLADARYGPATNLCLRMAREAVADAGWTPAMLREAWLFVGSSRGNAAGWLHPWPGRRGHRQMAASNAMHSEMAAAVSIELGIRGPYQVLSNGCSSGLDAVGFGAWAVHSGLAPRALCLSADLPLVPALLNSYAQTGLLSRDGVNDPYSPHTTGFLPGEAGAALALEPAAGQPAYATVAGYWANSDAFHPLGLPEEGSGIAEVLMQAIAELGMPRVAAVCPHASGTHAHGQAERRALRAVFSAYETPISLHLIKPFTGHAIGASGAIDLAVLCHALRDGELPPNLPGLTGAGDPFTLPTSPAPWDGGTVLKISVGMGGHNAVIALQSSSSS